MLEAKKKDKAYFVRGPENITISNSFWDLPFIKESGVSPRKEYAVMEAHGDEVVDLPDYFLNYGSSLSCKNEVIVSNDCRYFLVQGHPEYQLEFNIQRAWKFIAGGGAKTEEEIEKMRERFLSSVKFEANGFVWRSFCYSFLKNKF